MKTKFLLFEITLICSIFLFTNHVYAANESNDTKLILEETNTNIPLNTPAEYNDSLSHNSVAISGENSIPSPGENIINATQTTSTPLTQITSIAPKQTSTTLTQIVDEYTITATGNMPEGAELSVNRVHNTNQLKEVIGEDDYTVYVAFDIEILVNGEVWQPVDDNETVTITATNIEIPAGEELKVYRIEDEALESISVPEGTVVELNATETTDGDIEVETEHFTTYTFGGVSYNSIETGTWLGMTYETYDTNGDGTAETLVMSGTQTQTVSISSEDSASINYYTKSPYYSNNITNIMFKEDSKLTDGGFLFYKCTNLTSINMTNADTSNVTYMACIFNDCSSLTNLDLSNFNTTNVTDMYSMFGDCSSLTSLDVSGLDTTNVTDMDGMFSGCSKLTHLDVSRFKTANVETMFNMFYECSSLTSLDVSGFNTSNVTDMSWMFSDCSSLTNLDLSNFNTTNVTDMNNMFSGCSSLISLDVSEFDISNVTDVGDILDNCPSLTTLKAPKTIVDQTIDLPPEEECSWHLDDNEDNIADSETPYTELIHPVTDRSHTYIRNNGQTAIFMDGMLLNPTLKRLADPESGSDKSDYQKHYAVDTLIKHIVYTDIDISTDENAVIISDASSTTEIYARFVADTSSIEIYCPSSKMYLNEEDHGGGNWGSYAFAYMEALEDIDLSRIYATGTIDIGGIFENCKSLQTIDVSHWDTSSVFNFNNVFKNCSSLTEIVGLDSWDTSSVISMISTFSGCEVLPAADVSNWNISNVTTLESTFYNCKALATLDVSNWNTSNVTTLKNTFYDCNSLGVIDVSNWITNNVTTLENTFIGCHSAVSLGVSNWNTSNVTTLNNTFAYCRTITELDLTSWNTSKVTSIAGIFRECTSLATLDITNWNTSKITNMREAFRNCKSITELDLSSWIFNNVNMYYMFCGCDNLKTIKFPTSNVCKVVNVYVAFSACVSLKELDLSSFDVSSVDNLYCTFNDCQSLEKLNLTGWNCVLTGTLSLAATFRNCSKLEELDLSGITIAKPSTDSPYIWGTFDTCRNLKKFKAPKTNVYAMNLPTGTNSSSWYINDIDPAENEADNDVVYTKMIAPTTEDSHYYIRSDVENFSISKAILKPGIDFNNTIKDMLGEKSSQVPESDDEKVLEALNSDLEDANENIKVDYMLDIIRYTDTPFEGIRVDDSSSDVPIYARLVSEDGKDIIELYCANNKIYLNRDSKYLFSYFLSLESADLSRFDTSLVTKMGSMFRYDKELESLTGLDTFDTSNVTTLSYMFKDCHRIIDLNDINSWDVANVTGFYAMLNRCYDITNLDLNNWDMSSATDISFIFAGDSGLTSLSVGSWTTSNVTKMKAVFQNCRQLESIDLHNWNTSKVTDMSHMFGGCYNLVSLDLSSFDTSNVTTMKEMFSKNKNATSFDIDGFNTSKVKNFDEMFLGCLNVEVLDISNFDMSGVKKCDNIKRVFSAVSADSSDNDIMKLTRVIMPSGDKSPKYLGNSMFYHCDNLSVIEGLDRVVEFDESVFKVANVESGKLYRILTFIDYDKFTSNRWFDYNWAADGRSVCIYDVSIPAITTGLKLSTKEIAGPAGALDVSVEKFVNDEDVTFTTPSALKLTSTTDPEGYLTYMFTQDDTSKAYSSLKDEIFTFSDSNTVHTDSGVTENTTGPKYSVKERYTVSVFKGQDQNLKGLNYTGNIVLSFGLAN